jgi:hypothetical protein
VDIKDYQVLKKSMEYRIKAGIAEEITRFYLDTGLQPTELKINILTGSTFEKPGGGPEVTKVQVKTNIDD